MPDRSNDPDRLEREINEILSNIEHFPDPAQRKARARRRQVDEFLGEISIRQREFMRRVSRVSLSQLMLASFLTILGSFFFRGIVPIAWPWLMYAGVILFLATFTLMAFSGGRAASPAPGRYWRGREMEYRSLSLSQRVRRWWITRRR